MARTRLPLRAAAVCLAAAAVAAGGAAADDAIVNPVLGQAAAIAAGRVIYRTRCYICHLSNGGRGPDLFAEDRDEDLYAAIDKVTKKIEGQIRKRHNKAKARHHNEASKTKRKLKERGL